jgi:hypothetical protein
MARTRRNPPRRANQSLLTSFVNTSTNILLSPSFLAALIIGVYLNSDNTLIRTAIAKFQANKYFKPFGDYLNKRLTKLPGCLTVSLAAFSAAAPRMAMGAGIFAAIVVLEILPASNFIEYGFLAYYCALFASARSTRNKVLVLALAMLTIAMGWWGSELFA